MIETTRDKAVKATLDYYSGGLPSNFLGAILHNGKYPQGFQKRLGRLRDTGELHLLDLQSLDKRGQSGYRKKKYLCYQKGGQRSYKSSAHKLTESLVEATFQIAAPQLGLQFLPQIQVLALPQTPYSTASSKTPLELCAVWGGEEHTFFPDGHNFHLNGPNGAFSFLFEIDRDTQPNRALTDTQRPYIEAKLRNYLAFTAKGKEGKSSCERHFGFGSALILFVTTSPLKCANFQQLLLSITDGKGASNILFKPFPDFLTMDGSMEPDVSFVADLWPRAGHAPFDIVQSLGGRKSGAAQNASTQG